MYSIVKKIILVFIISLFWTSGLPAEKSPEVLLRYGLQENIIKIVLESGDDMIKNSKTTTSLSSLKIEFPSDFELKKQKEFTFETTKKDRWVSINLKEISDVRTYRLTSPARIVFELKTVQKTQPAAQKPQNETSKQPDQKTQSPGQTPVQKPEQGPSLPPEKSHIVKTVVIDPGHGGYEFGITSKDLKEKDINLNLSKDLAYALSKKGIKALLTRKVDQSVPINERSNFANRNKPDLFLSIHSSLSDKFIIYVSASEDMITDPDIKPYSLSEKQNKHAERSRDLSKAISESLKNEFKADTISREMPLPVLSSIDTPAVLIEYPSPLSGVYDQKVRDRFVNSIIKGIAAYEK
jgi:N-acetylmuramoyl-L-alanine amidase